jgi:hypothetical protein
MAAAVVGEKISKLWGVVLILRGVILALHDSGHEESILAT